MKRLLFLLLLVSQVAFGQVLVQGQEVYTYNGRAAIYTAPVAPASVVIDGDFAEACGVNWVCGTGWAISGGKAVATATTDFLYQLAVFELGETYKIIYTISDYGGGTVNVRCGTGTLGAQRAADGTFEQDLVCTTSTTIIFDGIAAFTGKINNVSAVKQ